MKMITPKDGTSLDPFMGSGTTIIVAKRMNRNSIGIEIVPEYYEMVREQLFPNELYLLEPKTKYEKAKPKGRISIRGTKHRNISPKTNSKP